MNIRVPMPDGSVNITAMDGAIVHPRHIFGRLLGATDTLSATFDTLCPFSRPQRAALARNGLVYVSDQGNNRVQALTPTGSLRYEFGGENAAEAWRLECPLDLLILGNEVFVADSGHERIVIFDLAGEPQRVLSGGGALRANHPRHASGASARVEGRTESPRRG